MSKTARLMKDSGIEWIGEIPVGWSVNKLKHLLSVPLQYGANETGVDYDTALPRYIRITDIDSSGKLKQGNLLSLPETIARDYLLHNGDILFARSGATVGKTFFYQTDYGKCAFAGYLIRATLNRSKVLPLFLYYYTLSHSYDLWKSYIFIQSTIQNIGADKYSQLDVPLPPLPEQNRIAAYLDRKCGKIDAVIAGEEAIIEKLKGYKQSLITETVTKGLDPNAPMKDSGIEWIGEIPAGWDVVRLKYLVKISDGTHDTPAYIDISDNSHPLVTSKCIVDGIIYESLANHISHEDYIEINKRSKVSQYDVIMPMVGTVGNPALVENNPNYAIKNVALLRTSGDKNLGKFIKYLLSSNLALIQFEMINKGGVQNFISQEKLRNLIFVSPTNLDQVVAYLDKKCAAIDSNIASRQSLIEKLTAYKKSLIYEVVTGKKEV